MKEWRKRKEKRRKSKKEKNEARDDETHWKERRIVSPIKSMHFFACIKIQTIEEATIFWSKQNLYLHSTFEKCRFVIISQFTNT